MNTRILSFLTAVLAAWTVNAQVVLSNYEDKVAAFAAYGYEHTYSIVDNQNEEGNATAKYLRAEFTKKIRTDWHIGPRITWPEPVTITEETKYLHFRAKSNVASWRIVLIDEKNNFMYPDNQYITVSDTWQEFNLSFKGHVGKIAAGCAFINSNLAAGHYLCIDEFSVSDVLYSSSVQTAYSFGGFEQPGETPEFIIAGTGKATTEVKVVDNPSNRGLNPTGKCLLFSLANGSKDWTRAASVLNTPVLINEANKYLHVMAHISSEQDRLALVLQGTKGEKYLEKNELTQNEWTDLVFDLSEYQGEYLTQIGFCPWSSNSTIYIDEIEFNASAGPRAIVANAANHYTFSGLFDNAFMRAWTGIHTEAAVMDLRAAAGITEAALPQANCLIYANEKLSATNCIVNGEAEKVVLTDTGDFVCPEPFTAQSISCTLHADGEYGTLCLPFACGEGWSELWALTDITDGTARFRQETSRVAEAGVPYIVRWAETDKPVKALTASQVSVNGTLQAVESDGGFHFQGTYTRTDSRQEYIMQGAAFTRAENKVIAPFTAYMANEASGLSTIGIVYDDNDPTTAVASTENDKEACTVCTAGKAILIRTGQDMPVSIHAVNGQLIYRQTVRQGDMTAIPVQPGLYLVNGRKTLVK